MNRRRGVFWAFVTLVFLLIAASRLIRLNDLTMNRDEIWSVWQTFGTPAQIIQWTPYDWPPLYYLTLGFWRSLVAMVPVTLRTLSALLFPIGAAFLFRVMRRWRGTQAALLAALAYGALGFAIQLSLEVRGYALMLAFLPLALWLTVRYFDRPVWRRALPLALTMAAMFYTSITTIGAFAMLGLFTLIVYPRAIGRWVLPGVLAVAFAAPEVVNKAQYVTGRLAATQTLSLPPFIEALANIFRDYTGPAFVVWAGLFILGLGLMVVRRSGRRAHVLALLLWAAGMPVLLYLSNPVLGFFSPRYAWWVLPGLALLAAWGLAELPRAGQILAGGILALMLFLPLPRDGHYQIWDVLSPLGDDFAWLREHMQWGDVILSHDRNTCGATEEWDYYLRAYFPTGVRFVDTPAGFRRIWVLNPKDLPDDLQARLNDQHIPGRFVGPPGCLFRLYEAPPDVEGIAFANGMRFHGAEVLREGSPVSGPLVVHEGEAIQVRLWWSVVRPPELDYSVNTLLRRGSTVYDTVDGPPLAAYPVDAPTETSRWLPGTVYVETRTLTLPFPGANTYTVGMIVYFWADGVPISAPGVDSDGVLPLLQVRVKSY